jgi:hypothetical protein
MKKCKRCKKGGDFPVSKYSDDGFHHTCKECSKEITQERRRRLDVMLIGVNDYNVDLFSELHAEWMANGFSPYLKPVVVNDRCMTKMESKGLMSRKGKKVVMCGDVDVVFDSISKAVKDSGESRLYIKWSIENGAKMEGKSLWKLKK